MGARTLVFRGDGEPFLHPRLFDLIALAKNAGFRAVLLTNGTLIVEANAASLIDSRLDLLRVSLWATSAGEGEKNHPGAKPGLLPRVVNGLRLVTSAKKARGVALPTVALHLVINRHHYRGIGPFVDLALETSCDFVSFSPLHTAFGQLAAVGLSQEEANTLKVLLLRAKERLRSPAVDHNIDQTILRYKIGEDVRRKAPCYIGWLHPRIKVDGTVQPCNPCGWAMGNLNEQSFREIWNGPEYRSFRRKILSPSAAALIDERCDCSFCCHVSDNMRLHRFYKWFSPLSRRPES